MKKWLRGAAWTLGVVAVLVLALLIHVYLEGRPRHGSAQYVAMGSSFAAGPAITESAADSPWFCFRSRDNYAHQLARLRRLTLVDVSCGGATTRHILEGGLLMQPAQIDAVTTATELVTLTICGNDIAYLGNIMALGCDESTPWALRSIGACKTRSAEAVEQGLREVGVRLAAVAQEVRRRAPRANVVLVNYPTVLPDSGTCERLGLREEDVTQMRTVAARLAQVTREAAEAQGALLMDAMRLSQGHDVCAADSWINGMHPPRGLLGAPLHPTLAGMTAIAQGLNALLGEVRR